MLIKSDCVSLNAIADFEHTMKLAPIGVKETSSTFLYKSCIATLLALSFISGSTANSLCEATTESIADIETEYPLEDLAKLSIFGFEASISYVEGKIMSAQLCHRASD
eukprot:scaffold8882_cov86-Cylindrotheca_fusiformis.AAC.3